MSGFALGDDDAPLLHQYMADQFPDVWDRVKSKLPVAPLTPGRHVSRGIAFSRTETGRDGWIGACDGPVPSGWAHVVWIPDNTRSEAYTGEIAHESPTHLTINVSGLMTFPKRECVILRGEA